VSPSNTTKGARADQTETLEALELCLDLLREAQAHCLLRRYYAPHDEAYERLSGELERCLVLSRVALSSALWGLEYERGP
jgi:hypothetical protein